MSYATYSIGHLKLMRKVIAFVLLPLSFLTAGAHASQIITPGSFVNNPSIISFETGTTGLPTVPGVPFLNEGGNWPGWFVGSANSSGFFGRQGWSNLVSLSYSDLGLRFAVPQQAVGAWLGIIPNFTNTTPDVVEVRFLDSLNNVLASLPTALPQSFGSPVFVGILANEGITRVEFLGGNTGFFGVDNVTFGTAQVSAVVPEPGSAFLVTAALLIGAAVRRRN
jgi:hypothetical protein